MGIPDDPDIRSTLKKEDLRYTNDSQSGFFRQKFGKKFNYYDIEGHKIRDKKILARIDSLAIPPAWRDVWVSVRENGHLQATGRDERRRKQYIYHPDWISRCKQNKFSKMIDFGLALPKIRAKISYNLNSNKLDKERILATVVWLLEKTFIRIGNEEYSKENNSFGLTTLRRRHAQVRGDEITFQFRGKSGVESIIEVSNPTVAATIKKCIELPGYELFQFIDGDGNKHVVDSEDVNEFLQDVTRDDFTTKDFRTWGATSLSADNLYKIGATKDKKEIKQNIVETVKKVAKHLNNTVAVCRSYYIHPTVLSSYEEDALVPHFAAYASSKTKKRGLSWEEYALIKLLEKHPYKSA